MKNAIAQLKDKLESGYADYKAKWLQMTPAELIDSAEELEAVTRMAKDLPTSISEDDAEFLLRFKNPLEVISDAWVSDNGIDSLIIDEEIGHIIWHIANEDWESYSEAYELNPDYMESQEQSGLDMQLTVL